MGIFEELKEKYAQEKAEQALRDTIGALDSPAYAHRDRSAMIEEGVRFHRKPDGSGYWTRPGGF